VPPSILDLASAAAHMVSVGKRCGRKSVSQEQINARIIAFARLGLAVVRLKGGDPSVFGRSGEEITALREAEIEYEVVPGVTAASAAAAAAGISLTQRHVASSVVFLTGHARAGKLHSDWPKLDSRDEKPPTVVVYMPGPDYPKLRDRLMATGLAEHAPCLLISNAATDACRTRRTTLAKLADAPAALAPNLLIVGEVVKLARDAERVTRSWQALSWRLENPLGAPEIERLVNS